MAKDIVQRIRRIYPKLTKGQKRIAALVLREYDQLFNVSALSLAREAKVSQSTVMRFVAILGYDKYSEFQNAIQEMVKVDVRFNEHLDLTRKQFAKGDMLKNVLETDIQKIQNIIDRLSRNDFRRFVHSIMEAKRVYIIGSKSAEGIAQILAYNLSLIIDDVVLLKLSSAAELLKDIYSIKRDEIFLAISFPRYSNEIITAAKYANDKMATTLAITDSASSELIEHANNVIVTETDMGQFTDSMVAALSIVNAIVVQISYERSKILRTKFNNLEKVWREYGAYPKYPKK